MKTNSLLILILMSITLLFCKKESPVEVENEFNYEMDEDIIYVQNNNYYFRDKFGILTQITNTSENISSEVAFYSDNKSFVYVSSNGSSYKINKIDLTSLQHEVLYESDKALRSLRISPSEDKIYFIKSLSEYWEGSIAYYELSSRQVVEVDPGPYYKALLFNDCNRVAYSKVYYLYVGRSNFLLIKNFVNGDTTLVDVIDRDIYPKSISNSDQYLLYQINDDGNYVNNVYDIVSQKVLEWNWQKWTGYEIGKFMESSNVIYGIIGRYNLQAVMINTNEFNMIIIEKVIEGIDFNFLSFSDFNTLSFSEESNIYLYSLNGDIKVYDANTGKSYDFIATEANEFAARFVNVR